MASGDRVNDDELKPEETEGFKVGEKKTIEEYHKLGKCQSTTFFLHLTLSSTVFVSLGGVFNLPALIWSLLVTLCVTPLHLMFMLHNA
jgi:hypothetical protein